jgi:hypothetical protein
MLQLAMTRSISQCVATDEADVVAFSIPDLASPISRHLLFRVFAVIAPLGAPVHIEDSEVSTGGQRISGSQWNMPLF